MTSWSFSLRRHVLNNKNEVTTFGGNISEATEKDYNDFWMDDGISLTGNPYYQTDTITLTDGPYAAQPVSMTFGGEDHISLNLDMTTSNNPHRFKYSEERILKELTDYISATYNQHYSSGDDAVSNT